MEEIRLCIRKRVDTANRIVIGNLTEKVGLLVGEAVVCGDDDGALLGSEVG